MSLQLLAIAGPDAGKAFILHPGPDLMLGRSGTAYYQVSDASVSRNHCQLLREGDRVTVIDHGSSSGTHVNGQKVSRRVLVLGDVLQVGDTRLRLQVGEYALDVALAHAANPAPAAKPATGADQLAALTGQKISHYDVGPVLGRGRSGVVFRATDVNANRAVALKVLLPEFARDEESMQRFVRAMKTVLPLRHPNLVTLYGAGKTGPHCWTAMELVEGESMTQVIQRIGVAGMLDWRYGYRMAVHIARALEYAHSNSIIHRNVAPNSILWETAGKTAKLGDLMFAKALEGNLAQQITRPGEIVGEVAFMSPERTRAEAEVDERSDLYGLGATLYALLAGRPPFEGGLIEMIARIRQTEPVKPTQFQKTIPHRLEEAVLKLMAKDSAQRYPSAKALLADLDRIGKMHSVTA
ncbi:MAG TPA: FHA domain-containing serine/threonine-protein kinase [Gemmataceae bacterium]|nr:FHA domain-containing serine/threonine-protein kinase [Gemmataceae bacterium]